MRITVCITDCNTILFVCFFRIGRDHRACEERTATEQARVAAFDRRRPGRRGGHSNDEALLGGGPERAARLPRAQSHDPPSQQVK